jgi:hypothetical protein
MGFRPLSRAGQMLERKASRRTWDQAPDSLEGMGQRRPWSPISRLDAR